MPKKTKTNSYILHFIIFTSNLFFRVLTDSMYLIQRLKITTIDRPLLALTCICPSKMVPGDFQGIKVAKEYNLCLIPAFVVEHLDPP